MRTDNLVLPLTKEYKIYIDEKVTWMLFTFPSIIGCFFFIRSLFVTIWLLLFLFFCFCSFFVFLFSFF